MTKGTLKFPSRHISYAPKLTSRRLGLKNFHNAAYKSDGGEDEAKGEVSEEEAIKQIGVQVEGFKALLGEKADASKFADLEKQIEDLSNGINEMKAADISKAIESINKANADIHKQIIELQEEAAKSKDAGTTAVKSGEVVSETEVKAFVEATFVDGEKTSKAAKISIKAAETFGEAVFFTAGTDTTAFTGRFVDPRLYQRKRKRNLILDNFNIQTINVPTLLYLVKLEVGNASSPAGDPGAAAWIASGAPKPKRSFRVTTGRVDATKVAIFGTVEDKLLKDIASLQNWIREDFMDEMREAINDGLLNNDPAVNALAPLGIKTNAVQYTATPGYDDAIENPNYIDAIIAAIAFMAYNKEEAGMVFVSSDVYYRIMHLKATDGKWLNNNLVYVNSMNQLFIAGVMVDWADEEDIPSANILVVGRDLGFKIYAYGPMVFERGLNGEDFREDKTSFRGYQEFLSFIPENRENSVMYDTFANIIADITGVPAP